VKTLPKSKTIYRILFAWVALSVTALVGGQDQRSPGDAGKLVSRLEAGESLEDQAFRLQVRDANFDDAQRIRLTALLLQEGYAQPESLISSFTSSKSFATRLPPAAITNLIGYIDRATQVHREEDRVSKLLVVAMKEGNIDEAAFVRISGWLAGGVDPQRYAAIRILSAVQFEDTRLHVAAGLLARHLEVEPDDLAADMTIHGVATLAKLAPLRQETRDSVWRVATTHRRGIIRVSAADVLIDAGAVTQPDALAAAIEASIGPNSPRQDRSSYDPRTLNIRALDVLEKLYQPPYPAHVIDAWIGAIPDSFGQLTKARAGGLLSAAQLAALEQRAADGMMQSPRFAEADQIYEIVLSGVDLAGKTNDLVADFSAGGTPARYAAAFRLRALARSGGVEPEVAAAARRVVLEENAPIGLRRLAAEILVASRSDDSVPILMTAIQESGEAAALEFLGPVFLQGLEGRQDAHDVLIGYGSDITLRPEFRQWLIGQLSMKRPESKLSEEHERRLRTLAVEDPDRYVRRNAALALRAFGVRRPLATFVDSGELQSNLIVYGLIALAIAYVAFAITGLFRFRRWALAGWILFSLWMIPCFGLALLGMMGHNHVPPWTRMLEANWPLYISFAVYAAWLLGSILWSRRRSRGHQTSPP
jgi:hypothetical protein